MKSSLAFAATVMIAVFLQNFQVVYSFSDDIYPSRCDDKDATAEYTCRNPQCTQYVDSLKASQTATLSALPHTASYLKDYSKQFRQLERLQYILDLATNFNLTQCIQDFEKLLELQRTAHDSLFKIWAAEATKQDIFDYVSSMTALKNIIFQLDAECDWGSNCTKSVEYKVKRVKNLAEWYSARLFFDTENRIRNYVEFKMLEQLGVTKKNFNTVKECISCHMTIP